MRMWIYVAVVALISGCVTGDGTTNDSTPTPGESPTPTSTSTPVPQICEGFGAVDADFIISFELDGRTREALDQTERLLATSPGRAHVHRLRVVLFHSLGKLDQARQAEKAAEGLERR